VVIIKSKQGVARKNTIAPFAIHLALNIIETSFIVMMIGG